MTDLERAALAVGCGCILGWALTLAAVYIALCVIGTGD
jgi:hypothetical protein